MIDAFPILILSVVLLSISVFILLIFAFTRFAILCLNFLFTIFGVPDLFLELFNQNICDLSHLVSVYPSKSSLHQVLLPSHELVESVFNLNVTADPTLARDLAPLVSSQLFLHLQQPQVLFGGPLSALNLWIQSVEPTFSALLPVASPSFL